MNRNTVNNPVLINMFCESLSYKFRLLKNEVLFERVTTVVFCVAFILVGACSLADDANVPSSSDKLEQSTFSEKDRKAGDRVVKVINGVEFAFRWCPFRAEESEKDRNNANQLSITLQGFWIMETEVTVGMFRAFVEDTGYESHGDTPETVISTSSECGNFGIKSGLSWDKPGFEQNDSHPVTCVSWEDAVEFNKWLAGKLKKKVFLPTEKQWLCACRAGSTGAFSGNLKEVAWYWKNSNASTHPAGTKTPNAWGLFDMYGNAWEWCSDEKSDGMRTRQGGSYGVNAEVCSSEIQRFNLKSFRCSDVGFRSAVEPDPIPLDLGIGTQAGERKTCIVNGVEFAFRWCPPGTFTMGSPESENERKSDELQHQVTFTKGFWMMEIEVTQEQWEAMLRNNPSMYKGQKTPVTNVSWIDSLKFCLKCTKLGLNLQLPTEAQWEYACRAGTTDAFADEINEVGWTLSAFDIYEPKESKMGRMKMPNGWGLYDMHGNVYELCADWYGNYPHQNVIDPEGPKSGTYRVMRGGCATLDPKYSRSANRGKCFPDYKASFLGFRCVMGKGVSWADIPKTSVEKADSTVTRITEFGKGSKAGERKTVVVKGVEFAFRWCPPGTFMRGSPESEKGRFKDEQQHEVTLTKGFWIMETEVSEEQWFAIMNAKLFPDFEKFAQKGILWNDNYKTSCQIFCQKCSEIGLPVQLPTEAQWEYACRAGTTGPYAGELDEIAWYKSNSSDKIHSCGKKKPNAWGIYDMHGNLWEWCQDWYGDYPSGSVTDPTGPESGTKRVIRGGAWVYPSEDCRSARRKSYSPNNGWFYLGFRGVIIPND